MPAGGLTQTAELGSARPSQKHQDRHIAAVRPERRSLMPVGEPKKSRVLVIDDVRDEAELMKLLVERLGYDVVAETSVQAALDLAAREDFDVVLTDLGMGEMSGLE